MSLRLLILTIIVTLTVTTAGAQDDVRNKNSADIIKTDKSNGGKTQNNNRKEKSLVNLDDPTFVPTVKVGKVLDGGDSIPYMEMSNVYVYPEISFNNQKEAAEYMRLVKNVKKYCPLQKR